MAIASAEVKVCHILTSGNLPRQDMADLLVNVLGKLKKLAQGNQAPFIAKVFKDKRVERWRTKTQLLKTLT
jgi:hypothetical protein